MDAGRAAEIAQKFFSQHHSDVIINDVIQEANVWIVIVSLGLVNKQNRQVKIDGKTGMIIEYSSIDYETIIKEILAVDEALRYVIMTDEDGVHLVDKMKNGKSILFKTQDQFNMVSSELLTLRQLLKIHNSDLGPVSFTHFVREKVQILIYFLNSLTICVSCERSTSPIKVTEISEKISFIIKRSLS